MGTRQDFDATIVAIATPLGEAGLGVIRLSGSKAFSIAEALFEGRTPLSSAATHTLHHGWISRQGERLDEAIAAVFRAPKSYTGEDVVEFSCHGSPAVLRELLAWCCQAGARLAMPGEFTERAYLNGRIDLAQAESVATLIGARSAKAARAAALQLAGGLSTRISSLRERLVDLLGNVEANLDFVEEDIPPLAKEKLLVDLESIQSDIQSLLATTVRGRWLREGASVVLTGRPNVGKSSLFNAFLAEERAIVTDVPGTTRDTLEERVSWEGYPLRLLDTAGQRNTTDPVESIGADRARRAGEAADLVVLVLDGSVPLSESDRTLAQALKNKPAVVALNKSDIPSKVKESEVASLELGTPVRVSALAGTGLEELRSAILSRLPTSPDTSEAGLTVTQERHAERLADAATALEAALQALKMGRSEEAVSSDIRRACEHLAAITGEDVNEAVLSSIFRRFCIGK